jgi:hypothetical protein
MMDSAYANPQPYDLPDLERSALAGRIRAARRFAEIYESAGDRDRAARWLANADSLLEHYAAADDRATTAAMDRAEADHG